MVGPVDPEELVPERPVLTFLFLSKIVKNVQIRSKAALSCSNHRLKNTKRAPIRGYLEKTKPISYRRERRARKDKALPFMGRLDTQSP